MKRSLQVAILVAAIRGFTSGVPLAHAQTWRTVDDYTLAAGQSVIAAKIVCGQSGRVLAGITFSEVSGGVSLTHTRFRRSSDYGATWADAGTLPTPPSGAQQGSLQGLSVSPTGDAYALRHIYPYWQVHRSSMDTDSSWPMMDNFLQDSASVCSAVACSPSENVFVVGQALGPNSSRRWLVRRSADQGQTWTTVDDFNGIWASAVATSSSMIIVSGRGGTLTNLSGGINADQPWTTRLSTDGGNSWTTVDSFQLAADTHGWPKAAAIDQQGNLYLAGNAEISTGSFVTQWIVRRSVDGGQTWDTVDTLDNGGLSASAESLVVDASGKVFAAGRTSSGWLVRVSTNGGTDWTDSELYDYPSGQAASVKCLAADADGNVLAIGTATDTAGNGHFVVRRLDGPPRLMAGLSRGSLGLMWSTNATGYLLQSATTLANGGDWQDSGLTPTVSNGQNVIAIGTTNTAGFFRLRQP